MPRESRNVFTPAGRPPENLNLFGDPGPDSFSNPFHFEVSARDAGYRFIAGVDEAGRGPLAGPVVAAAVILPRGEWLEGVTDSKKMSPGARRDVFDVISGLALSVGIGVVSQGYIDEHNILRATLEAMKRAVLSLEPRPDFLIVDGVNKVPLGIGQLCLKKGDQRSRSVSAASVMAKVYRDRIMEAYHGLFPDYGFDSHKGYGTSFHLRVLRRLGPSPAHRMTFRGVLDR